MNTVTRTPARPKTQDHEGANPPRPPSPEQLPVSTQEALANLLAAARRPFVPSIAQLATENLVFFLQLRGMGAHWQAVADFLFEQGLTGPAGKISANVWRATVSRVLRDQKNASAARTAALTNSAKAIETTEAQRNETPRPVAQQSVAERDNSRRAASQRDASKRVTTTRSALRVAAAKQNGTERSVPQASETPRKERRKSAEQRNAGEPPPATFVQTPPELRADSELARIADLIDKPFNRR